MALAGHAVEYAGYTHDYFRIDGNRVIEDDGEDKGFSQLEGQGHAFATADNNLKNMTKQAQIIVK